MSCTKICPAGKARCRCRIDQSSAPSTLKRVWPPLLGCSLLLTPLWQVSLRQRANSICSQEEAFNQVYKSIASNCAVISGMTPKLPKRHVCERLCRQAWGMEGENEDGRLKTCNNSCAIATKSRVSAYIDARATPQVDVAKFPYKPVATCGGIWHLCVC